MARKRKEIDKQEKQLSLFNIEDNLNSEQSDNSENDWLNEDYGFDSESSDRTIEPEAM